MMRRNQILPVLMAVFAVVLFNFQSFAQSKVINIIFTSDAHFGISRAQFRGDTSVAGIKVNAAMIARMNTLPGIELPKDNGVGSGKKIGAVDYLVQGGDVANREEVPIQSAAASWAQFDADYMHSLTLKDHDGKSTKLFI